MYAKSGSGETGIVTKELIESVKSMIVKEGSADFWWTDKYDQELIKAAGVDPTAPGNSRVVAAREFIQVAGMPHGE
jgi:hypothetical protein